MSKQKSIELSYDAPIEDVTAMLGNAEFRAEVCRAQHATSSQVDIDGTEVEISYTQPVSGIPGFARKFVGDSIEVVQSERWNQDFTRGEITVTLPGKPGDLSGTATVTEQRGRVVETVALTATVNVPLVAGKLEDLVLGIFDKALAKEHEVGRSWLAR